MTMGLLRWKVAVVLTCLAGVVSTDHAFDRHVSDQRQQPRPVMVRVDDEVAAEDCTHFHTRLESLLTATSEQLYEATRGRQQWGRVRVLAPANWQHCLRGVTVVDQWPQRFHGNDLLVGRTHPLLADLPWARQFGPCGVQGSDLYLSHRFVQSTASDNLVRHGRQLLREWIKYRYGVFDEVGYRSDDLYPLTYNEANQLLHNDCSTLHNSSQIVYEVDSRSNATVAINVTTSRRGTSILASLDAYDFCDVATHNRGLPTKQNVLCEERSVWEVMRQHADFRTEFRPEASADPRSRRSTGFQSANGTSDDNPSPVEVEQTPEAPLAATSEAPIVSSTESDDSATTEPPQAPFQAPKFEYVFPSRSRYVLVLDRSHLMARKNRWTMLRRALYRWIHSIPNDTQLAVVVGGAEPAQVLPWTRVTADNRDGLVGRIPRRPLATPQPFCLDCALQLAAQLLRDREEATCCGGHVILVTSAAGLDPSAESLEPLRHQLDASGAQVHVVAFPSQMALPSLPQLTAPAGAFLAVPETNEAGPVTQWRLTSALLQVLRHDARPDAPNQVYKEYLMPRDGLSVLGSFTLDAPLGTNVWIVAHCADEADLDTMEVISPSGRIFDLPQVSDGMLHIRIPDTREFGDWSYRLRFSHPTRDHLAAAVEVTAQPSLPAIKQGQQQQEPITVRTWNNVGHQMINASQSPIMLYVQVLQAQTPIINAKVTALVYRPKRTVAPPTEPSVNATADSETEPAAAESDDEPFEIQLHDRGTGDPDITRSDGIYSAYFTGANDVAGHYSVVIRVTDNGRRASIPLRSYDEISSCCGSFVPYGDSMPCQPFSRIVNGPSFTTLQGPSTGADVYPPSRISDLRVERVLNGSGEAELVWTAPGGDFDSGSSAFYEIRCYTDRSTLNDPASAILVHASLTPVPGSAGAWQRSTVAVPWPNQLFYYAVVAVDAAGNRGRVSNIVPVFIDEPPPPPTTLPPPSARDDSDDPSNGTLSGAVWRNPSTSSVLTETQLYAIAGGVAGFVLLLIVLSVAAFASRRKSAQADGVKNGSASAAATAAKIQVEPLKTGINGLSSADLNDTIKDSSFCSSAPSGGPNDSRDRPVYKIYVNNAYIQEEDGELKIVTPDGRIIQRGSPWFSTLPRGRSLNNLEGASINDLTNMHWSLPRSKTSPHRHKVLTNGSIMQTGGGSQGLLGGVVGSGVAGSGSSAAVGSSGPGSSGATGGTDGTSISSKPSVSSDDTGIEVNDHHGVLEADSRDDSADSEQVPSSGLTPMLLPPPGFGTLQPPYPYQNGYVPMYSGYSSALVPPLPPSPPGSQDARVVRIPSIPNQFDHHHLVETDSPQSWMTEFNDPSYSQPSNRRPLVGHLHGFSSGSFRESNHSSDDSQLPAVPSTPTSLNGPKKKRHISFV